MLDTRAEVLVAGSRHANGVAGMMYRGLSTRGVKCAFAELLPTPSMNLLVRASRRVSRHLKRILPKDFPIYKAMMKSRARFVIVADGKHTSVAEASACRQLADARRGGIAQFLCDDPFAPGFRESEWRRGLSKYHVVFSTKRRVIDDVRSAGVADVRFSWFAFDPVFHPLRGSDFSIDPELRCDVAFAGVGDKDRREIFERFVRRAPHLTLRLFGGWWEGSRRLRSFAGPPIFGLDYARAMHAAHACPCMVRECNRDGHAMRSLELPAMGCFMLAQRTEEHMELFEDGRHCVMWDCAEELADKCLWYHDHPRERSAIAHQGAQLIRTGAHTYGDRALEILRAIGFTSE